MYIIIEHSGTSDAMDIVEEIEEMLADDGHVTEQIVSSTDVVTLYNEDNKIIGNFNKIPEETLLRFYVELANEE